MAALSFFSKIISSVLITASAVSAFGQTYPNRPIRLIAPFPAGSGVDIMARIIGEKLTESWRQQVIVDNRSEASGIIGSEIAAKSSADGYTLIMSNASTP